MTKTISEAELENMKFIIKRNISLLVDNTHTKLKATILNDIDLFENRAKQAGQQQAVNEVFRIMSEELSVSYPDSRKGFDDRIEMNVDDLCDEIEKLLKGKLC